MSLFVKPLKQITYQDIEDFCKDGIPEGLKVEYKWEFSNNDKMAKEISSFANHPRLD